MQIKVWFFDKIFFNFFFSTLLLILFIFEAVNACFLLNWRTFGAILLKIKFSKMAAMMADMLWNVLQ